ncbi:hypothetical protein L6452_32618 [Arctium lappa]|uniref:Uncharacterized protein n=1 Tax=Arctium lappa TaxID=4217 RepID=A0ACB8Z503_ARCLA|nr:hypothetical protein L6452_32618 [Arctium lappa]
MSFTDHLEYALHVVQDEPFDYSEALPSSHCDKWLGAMHEEMEALSKNNTWELCPLPKGNRAIGCKWVYKVKDDKRYKARLVAKGFAQRKGIEYDDIFAPVVRHTSIRVLLALVAILDLELEQLDVKTAFLHGDLEETIYMKQPEGFISDNKPDWVCKLKKSLYVLKQSPRQWYKKFDLFMLSLGFERSEKDACVYHRSSGGISIYLLLYVDDMLIACRDRSEINRLKDRLKLEFEMKDLGKAHVILGMEIVRDRKSRTLRLTQKGYIQKILKRFNLDGAKSVSTPLPRHIKITKDDCPVDDIGKAEMAKIPYASAVGSLMYAMVCTRPDLAHSAGVISRFLSNPGKSHWNAVKTVFRYLKGTETHGLIYGMQNNCDILGYCDSDYAGDRVSWKSTSGYVFTLGGTTVSWRSRLQSVVALSTTEAKLIAAVESAKEAVHLQELLFGLGLKQTTVRINCDSQSAIHLATNLAFSSRTKHINVRDAFLVALHDVKVVYLKKILSEENII